MTALPVRHSRPVTPSPDADMTDILFVTVAEIEVLGNTDPHDIELSIGSYFHDLREIGVPYRPSVWFHPLSSAQRKRYSRATMRLERYEYLDRIVRRKRERVTHIRPLYDALAWVIAATGTVNLAHLAEGLRRCEWAGHVYDEFRRHHREIA